MVIKPPRDLRRGRILEIYDRILVTGEVALIEQRTRTMQQSAEDEFRIVPDPLLVETRKQCRRASPIKTLVVIKNLDFQSISLTRRESYTTSNDRNYAEVKAIRMAIRGEFCQARAEIS